MAMKKLSDVEEWTENIIQRQDNEIPLRMDTDFDLLPLGIDLKKLLLQVTGEKNVKNITRLRLKVVTKQAGLHRLAEYTPRLKVLILDDSSVDSLRDLGSELNNLETLSLARCSLKSLDGLWGFSSLKALLARGNEIKDISICSGVNKLKLLDVAYNVIEDVSTFAYLKNCKHLRVLNVAGNRFSDYRNVIKRLIPQLRVIDDEEVGSAELSTGDREKGVMEKHLASEDDGRLSFSDHEKIKVPLTLIEMDTEDNSLEKIFGAKPRARELGAGDERGIVSMLNKRNDKNNAEGDKWMQAKEINLDPSSSSVFLMTNEADVSPMFDLPLNMGDYRRSQETTTNKLSSGSAICGNLAASLRSRNLSKNPFTLATSRASLQHK